MRKLHVIMPMAGEGSRFKQAGIEIPKPLIKANGVPFFVRSLYGIRDVFNLNDIKITCIIQRKHDIEYGLCNAIKSEVPTANVVILDTPTNGAVETCLSARKYISATDAIIVLDCDLEWHCYNYISAISSLLNETISPIGGMLLSFNSNDSRYSYALTENGIVIKTAEKNPISNNALIGAYYFNTANDFIDAANRLIKNNELSDIKEYYTSLLYNYIISRGKLVRLYTVDCMYSFGTPEELKQYEQLHGNPK